MKLFISYARIDKPYCVQLVNTLDVHDVWYDQRLYAGQQWWEEILRRLDWCEALVFLLSPESVNSEYCMKELDIAMTLGRAVIPVLTQKDTVIPQQIAELQYIDASQGLDAENTRILLNSIYLAEQGITRQRRHQASVGTMSPEIREPPVANSAKIIGMAASALENAQYDRAVYLLKQARAQGYQSRFINIESLLAEAELALEKQALKREAKREYDQIVALANYKVTLAAAIEAFDEFKRVFPDYDPEMLADRFADASETPKPVAVSDDPKDWEILPMLKWLPVSVGVVRIDSPAYGELVTVDDFWMAKYPITNEQFDVFRNDPDGYTDERWWCFSEPAQAWFRVHQETGSLASRFKGHNHPREMVNWYEAMAFCHWLGHKLDRIVTLPTLAQWQAAAVGDSDTNYPWGNEYEAERCNTRESQLRMTTPVNRYPNGQSRFEIFDMAGNVWEWTIDSADEKEDGEADCKRAVIGGSHVSPRERAHASFNYFLKPESRFASIGFRTIVLPPGSNPSAHLKLF